MSEAKVAVPKAAQPKAAKASKPKPPTTVSLSQKKIGKNRHPKQKSVTKKDRGVQSKRDRAIASGYVAPSVKPGPKKTKAEKPKAVKKAKKTQAPKVKKAKATATTGDAKTPVPESLKKKLSARQLKVLDNRKAKHQIAKKKASTKRVIYKRAEYYAAKYKRNERALIKLRRVARNAGGFFREPEPKIALVVRIRGINGVDPRTKKILQLFRLRQIHNATFVKLNAATIKMLRLVEPYVTYGTPNLKTVRHLIYKRGCLKVHGQRIPICSNGPIAQKFKKINLICVEDLIHQVFTCGKHFKKVNKNLWPFKLNSPKGGYKQKTIHFQEGGDAGNREDKINSFVQRMI